MSISVRDATAPFLSEMRSPSGVRTRGANAAFPSAAARTATASRNRRPDCRVGTTTRSRDKSSGPSPLQPAASHSTACAASGRSHVRKCRRTLGGAGATQKAKRRCTPIDNAQKKPDDPPSAGQRLVLLDAERPASARWLRRGALPPRKGGCKAPTSRRCTSPRGPSRDRRRRREGAQTGVLLEKGHALGERTNLALQRFPLGLRHGNLLRLREPFRPAMAAGVLPAQKRLQREGSSAGLPPPVPLATPVAFCRTYSRESSWKTVGRRSPRSSAWRRCRSGSGRPRSCTWLCAWPRRTATTDWRPAAPAAPASPGRSAESRARTRAAYAP